MERKSHYITHRKSLGPEIEKHNISFEIPQFDKMLTTKAMLGECRTKYSIVQVPDSPFQLKLIISGSENELLEIYYSTNLTFFMKYELWINSYGKAYPSSNIYELRDFYKVLADKWHCCASVLDPSLISRSLHLQFVFTISREVMAEDYSPQSDTLTQLIDDFGILLTNGTNSDVTLKSAEGVEFKVHKGILAIRSAVLKAHFDHNTTESTTNIVETTWETEVLRDVLNYVYTGTAPRVNNDPNKLLAAADYYQLQGLKAHCETALYKGLTVENAIATLELAEQFSAKNLHDDTLAFIKDGRVKLMLRTESWSKLQSISTLKKLFEVMTVYENDIVADKLEEAYEELGEE